MSTLRRATDDGQQFLWSEGSSIRALASYVSPFSCGGARIRGVYTRPESRGRGYGTAITGALAERLLNRGQAWVGLFAENANLTSTGFRPHSLFHTWRFTRVPGLAVQ
jgi:predicted GNAT family acetyltransferase